MTSLPHRLFQLPRMKLLTSLLLLFPALVAGLGCYEQGTCPPPTQSYFDFVESIPQGLDLNPHRQSTYSAWMRILEDAKYEVDISCFYMTLTGGVPEAGGQEGQDVYNAIVAAAKRGVKVKIAITSPSDDFPQLDAINLQKQGLAEVHYVNFTALFPSGGILHTKMILADNSSFYVGSANIDWRSLTQVKELGAFGMGLPDMAKELWKIFQVYWIIGGEEAIPKVWPEYLYGSTSRDHPMGVVLNGTATNISVSMAPPAFRPPNWTPDAEAITGEMKRATDYVWIEVMTYYPAVLYSHPSVYWGVIDETIRQVQYNNDTEVRLLIGHWNHSIETQVDYLRSLNALPNVEVRYFNVPPGPVIVPYTRVNHAKWMMTDQSVYIGTSNWSGDYFTDTAGVGVVFQGDMIHALGEAIFLRDWNSAFTTPLPEA